MTTQVIILLLVVISAFFDAFRDHINFRINSLHPWFLSDFWNPIRSWRNKYKGGKKENGPAFFGAITFLVAFTDGFHQTKMLSWSFIQLAIVLAVAPNFPFIEWPTWIEYVLAYSLLWIIRATSFHLAFTYLITANNISTMQKLSQKLWSLFRAIYPSAPALISIAVGAVLFILLAGLSSLAPWMDYVVVALLVVSWLAGIKLLIKRFRNPKPEKG